jgi:hypothetical protein
MIIHVEWFTLIDVAFRWQGLYLGDREQHLSKHFKHIDVYNMVITYIKWRSLENYETINCNSNKEEKMALDRPYPKKTQWIHIVVGIGLESSGGSKARSSHKDLEKDDWGWSHGSGKDRARLKDWLLTGPGGGVSRMPYAPEGATRIKKMFVVKWWFPFPLDSHPPVQWVLGVLSPGRDADHSPVSSAEVKKV